MVGGMIWSRRASTRDSCFEAAGAAQQMAGHGFGGADGELVGVVAENALEGLVSMASPMGVEVPCALM